MDKQFQFINWLTGKTNNFPFFQSMPEVKMPVGWQKDREVKSCDEKYGSHLNLRDDIFDKENSGFGVGEE